jgi:hypothetical protein
MKGALEKRPVEAHPFGKLRLGLERGLESPMLNRVRKRLGQAGMVWLDPEA